MKRIYPLLLLCAFALGASAQTIYVRSGASGLNNGTSWANAFATLQPALSLAAPGQQIWVAAGTYKPDNDFPNNSFYFENGIQLYGGFNGTETELAQRNFGINPTILSGDFAGDDVPGNFTQHRADNSRHVIVIFNAADQEPAIIDGFGIRGGQTLTNDTLPGIDRSGAGIYTVAPLWVRNCRFWDNFGYAGAGIMATGTLAQGLVAENCIFEENTATEQSAGVYLSDLIQASVKNCIFRNNITNRGCLYPNNVVGLDIDSCLFENNATGPSQYGAGMFSWQSSFTLSHSIFRGNQAGNAGAMYCDGRDGGDLFVIDSCLFEDNFADGFGAGIFLWQADCSIRHSTFRGNEAPNAGAIYADGRDGISGYNVLDCLFDGNTTTDYGGSAIYNWKADYGVDGCTFLNNESAYAAGAIYSASSEGLIENSTFDGNHATFGGALVNYNSDAHLVLNGCHFLNNEAGTSGGGMIDGFLSSTDIYNCIFEGNLAAYGGAVYCQNDSTKLSVDHSIFSGNSGGNYGGAIHASGGVGLDLHNCLFETNTGGCGGAVSVSEDSLDLASLYAENIIFRFNYALTQAAGVNLSNVDASFVNCLFANNTNLGTGAGGAISNNAAEGKNAPILAVNCTFAGNVATLGAGIAQWEDDVTPGSNASLNLQNCILQHLDGANYEIEAGTPLVSSLGGNLSSDNSLATSLVASKDENNLSTSFVDPSSADYHLLNGDGSVLDGGIASGAPALDLEGNPRFGAPDKGCYEFGVSGTSAPVALPLAISPNPARDIVLLDWSYEGTGILQIADQNGRLLRECSFSKKENEPLRIALGDWPAGTYLIQVRAGGSVFAGKLLKQ